ncbi:DUF2804 domain-containing protein [Shewanella sp. Isolate11]|uniref:DUF2804 domain-containing protein n=1 Tax=Shewanella sp. Isolate11 TaxID=2908530 RepID=UPI001EFEE437|nr:DUF2804 domain-containing protein [Shewanella sp. Isolate11]MCG9697380.1 DUF2804 domain-containing protein [Shewanella sp. Isolate11]
MVMQTVSKTLLTQVAPESLILPSGQVQFGHFDGPVQTLGLAHFQYQTVMDKPAGSLARHFDFKQFQFISIVTPRFVVGLAIADIRYLGSGFCYLFDIKANRLIETSWLRPLGLGYQLSASPFSGRAKIGTRSNRIEFNLLEGVWQLEIKTAQITASLELVPMPLSLPMAMCNPTGYNGWTYTQKHNGLKPKGTLTINHEPQPLNQALAGYDFSAGYMRRETSWRWGSINSFIGDKVLGLNLAAGVNETGCNENVLWIDGARHLLGPVQFEFSRREGANASWRIYSQDGRVELDFHPRNCRKEQRNLWLLKSNFKQYLGYFDGVLVDNDGVSHQLHQVLGLCEDHFARW